MNSDTFKVRLKEAIGGVSIRAFADKCAVSEGTLRRYLTSDTYPPLDTLESIANAAVVSLAWLASGEGPMRRGEKTAKGFPLIEHIVDWGMDEQETLHIRFSDVWERLKRITTWSDYSDLANFLDIPLNYIDMVKSKDMFPVKWAFKIAHRFQAHTDWLMTGKGPMMQGEIGYPLAEDLQMHGYVHVPRYDIAASAGGGAMVHSEQVVDYLAFRKEWVQDSLRVDPRNLALIRVTGDSMEPTMADGDLVLVDTAQRRITTDSIYVVQLLDGLLVKRVTINVDGSVSIISDNTIYAPKEVRGEILNSLNVVGRVVWYGRRA